jgi:hypothetical protein
MIRRITPRAIAETFVFWSIVLSALEPLITPRGFVFLFYVAMAYISDDQKILLDFLLRDLFGADGVEALQQAAQERMKYEDPQRAAEERAAYEDWYAHKERTFKY